MGGGALFRVRTEARARVMTKMSAICLHKNEVGGYAYNGANMLLRQFKQVLKRQVYEDSSNEMKGLTRDISNTLNEYRSTLNTKKRDVLGASKVAANIVGTNDRTVNP